MNVLVQVTVLIEMLLSLRRLEVIYFRGVREKVVLDFTQTFSGLYFVRGINRGDARLGSNGAGKSSLFAEALIWALTGRTSRSQRPGSDVENRQSGGKMTSVVVELKLGDSPHRIERTRNPNNLLLDGSKVEQQEVNDLLPLSDAALRKSVLIDQFGEMFLSLKPEAKSQIFTETLDLDKWLLASDRAADCAADATRRLSVVERKVAANKAALAEVRDNFEAARLGEETFEADLAQQLKAAASKVARDRRQAGIARDAYNDAQKRFSALDDVEMTRELNEQRTQLRRLQRVVAEASSRLSASDRDVAQLEARLAEYHKDVVTCPECGQRVGEKHINQKRTEVRGLLENAVQLRKRYVADERASAKLLETKEVYVAQLEKGMTAAADAKAEVAACAANMLNADREVKRSEDEVAKLKVQTNPFTKACDDAEVRIKQLRKYASELKAEDEGANADLALYQFWQRGFREIRLQQIDDALVELEMAANRHAEALGLDDWRIEFATERETKKGSVSHGFTVMLHPPGEDPVNWDTYCGGEVQRWQLAVTFGLAEVLLARAGVSVDFEILDEPSTHLSPEGIEDLLSCLSDRARELDRKIWLIDHNSLDRGLFDGVVTIAKDSKRGTYVEDYGGVLLEQVVKRERVRL